MPAPILLACRFDAAEWARWLPALQAALPGETLWRLDASQPELPAHMADQAEVAIVANPPPGWLARCPRLGLIQSLWAGVDRLLQDPSLPAQATLLRMVDPAMSLAMAETAHWAALTLQRQFWRYGQQQRAGLWQALPQRRADEVRISVLGLGEMGRHSAQRLHAAGYPVTGWSRHAQALAGIRTLSGDTGLRTALAEADILINLLPLTEATRGLLNAERLAWLPPGAALVNLARGAHVVEADLLAALDTGHLSHAVLDVFATEPLPAAHPFWQHPRVTLLPHAAALTDERSAARIAAANIRAWRAGQPLRHQVDRQRGY